jgi:hypothetical protein
VCHFEALALDLGRGVGGSGLVFLTPSDSVRQEEVENEMLYLLSMLGGWSYIISLEKTGPSLMFMKRCLLMFWEVPALLRLPGITYGGNVPRSMLVGGMAFLIG